MLKKTKTKESFKFEKKRFPEIIIEVGTESCNSSPVMDRPKMVSLRKMPSSPDVVLKSKSLSLSPNKIESTPSPEKDVFLNSENNPSPRDDKKQDFKLDLT